MNGGDQIAQVLKQQGVKFIFTLCRRHISPILVGAKNVGIRVVDVRQEPTAVFAADAVSRLTGIPGVAAVLKYNDYHTTADALDAKGVLLERNTDIGNVLKTAKETSQKGRPVLINALMGKTDFRKGSISV